MWLVGAAVVIAEMGLIVAVVTAGAGLDVSVLAWVVVGSGATEVAVWMNAPPATGEAAGVEASGSALVVGAGAVSEVVVAAWAALEESDDPKEPETKESLLVRSATVPAWQELGPEDQPMRRLATSDAVVCGGCSNAAVALLHNDGKDKSRIDAIEEATN